MALDTTIYDDTFDQAPPYGPTILNNGVPTPITYFTNGSTWSEAGGKGILSSTGAVKSITGNDGRCRHVESEYTSPTQASPKA